MIMYEIIELNEQERNTIKKQSLCICKGKAAYNIPPPYLRIAKSLWAIGYEVTSFIMGPAAKLV
ncbi:hypothetical protein HKD37_01G002434 [Glycine soja]